MGIKHLGAGPLAALVMCLSMGMAWASPTDTVRLSGGSYTQPQDVPIEEIEELGVAILVAGSPADPTPRSFAGVWLHDFVDAYGGSDVQSVALTAIDYYQVSILRSEWEQRKILLATRENGKVLEFESRGPLRIIISDYDPNDELHQELTPKWIWMITDITFND